MKKRLANKYALLCMGLLGLIVLVSLQLNGDSQTTEPESVNAATTIWKLGTRDNSAEEFKGKADNQPAAVRVTSANQTGSSSAQVSSGTLKLDGAIPTGLNASINPELVLQYELDQVPPNGVLFNVRILDAGKAVPQMAVFSNRQLAGIIQIAGVSGTGSTHSFKENYQLYIPKEQLKKGNNELRLEAVRCLYCTSSEDPNLWWTWDDLNLQALSSPAQEPIHGRYIRTGTNVNNQEFYYDQGAVRHLPTVMKWLGVAYSGNIMRVTCASNVGNACSDVDDYYKTLKQYNMQAVALYLYTGDIKLKADGSLPDTAKQKLTSYLQKYGPYVQYFEVDNEPGLFNRSKAVNLAVAKWLNTEGKKIAPHLKTVAPGWAYWPAYSVKACKNQDGGAKACGTPDGWEADPKQRLELEKVTDLTNGHAYGASYVDAVGGSFVENLRTFGGANNGLSKPMLNTEFGTSGTHVDDPAYGASQPNAAAFDRIMRSQIGFADMFVQHAAFYQDFSLFKTGFDLQNHNPAATEVYPFSNGQDSRVDIMRRLSLAYATHGKPLTYTVLNTSDTADKLVYVRAVDTSSLAPIAGSGAKSNKQLVNLVNFEPTTQQIKVRVTMPQQGEYRGERIGSGATYTAAHRNVSGLKASPTLEFEETLGPGESVQYILEKVNATTASTAVAPDWVQASAAKSDQIQVSWMQSEGVQAYDVLRASSKEGDYRVIAAEVEGGSYADRTAAAGTTYMYKIRPTGSTQISEKAEVTFTGLAQLDRSNWKTSASVNSGNARLAIDGNGRTRWDTGSAQRSGVFYQVDLGATQVISRLLLDTTASEGDYPRAYDVQVSADGKQWTKVASGKGSGAQEDISFASSRARYLKITLTGTASNYWSIHELQLYGS
ncbi:discoidin domain-containing protein [Paenibacillus sp. FSL K6-1230]|uniref:discoidin domain-containing protein n=1 Tax=Paenibacillus sp. FSL K6-1230 TaxID=2921603 RepID=UPI0030F93E46